MEKGLTQKQKKFCQALMEGKKNKEAYLAAGYTKNADAHGTRSNAYKLKMNKNVQEELARLQALAEEGATLKREQRQTLLTEIALNDSNDMPDRLRAVDQLNRMSGDYTDTIRTTVNAKVEMTYAERLATMKADLDNETA